MAKDKKSGVTIEAPAPEEQRPEPPAPETPGVPAPLEPEALTVEEQLALEHEGRAALFEMGEVFPDDPEFPGVATLEPPAPEQTEQAMIPGMEGSPPSENKVINLSSVRVGAGQEQQAAPAPEDGQEWEKPQEEEKKPRRGRPPKGKAAPAQGDKPKRKGRPPKCEK